MKIFCQKERGPRLHLLRFYHYFKQFLSRFTLYERRTVQMKENEPLLARELDSKNLRQLKIAARDTFFKIIIIAFIPFFRFTLSCPIII